MYIFSIQDRSWSCNVCAMIITLAESFPVWWTWIAGLVFRLIFFTKPTTSQASQLPLLPPPPPPPAPPPLPGFYFLSHLTSSLCMEEVLWVFFLFSFKGPQSTLRLRLMKSLVINALRKLKCSWAQCRSWGKQHSEINLWAKPLFAMIHI